MKQRLICRIFIEAEMILFCICRILSNLVNIFKWFLQLSDTILFFIKFFWYMMQICFSIKRLKNRSGFRRSWVKHFHRHSTILGNTYQFFFFFFVCLFVFVLLFSLWKLTNHFWKVKSNPEIEIGNVLKCWQSGYGYGFLLMFEGFDLHPQKIFYECIIGYRIMLFLLQILKHIQP